MSVSVYLDQTWPEAWGKYDMCKISVCFPTWIRLRQTMSVSVYLDQTGRQCQSQSTWIRLGLRLQVGGTISCVRSKLLFPTWIRCGVAGNPTWIRLGLRQAMCQWQAMSVSVYLDQTWPEASSWGNYQLCKIKAIVCYLDQTWCGRQSYLDQTWPEAGNVSLSLLGSDWQAMSVSVYLDQTWPEAWGYYQVCKIKAIVSYFNAATWIRLGLVSLSLLGSVLKKRPVRVSLPDKKIKQFSEQLDQRFIQDFIYS